MQKKYHFYSDPAHGWLKVPIKELVKLGIAKDISNYSYQKGNYAYLEEDADATKFLNAMKQHGRDLVSEGVIEHTTDNDSPIRNYAPFVSASYWFAGIKKLKKVV
jgi:hypothetical protein